MTDTHREPYDYRLCRSSLSLGRAVKAGICVRAIYKCIFGARREFVRYRSIKSRRHQNLVEHGMTMFCLRQDFARVQGQRGDNKQTKPL